MAGGDGKDDGIVANEGDSRVEVGEYFIAGIKGDVGWEEGEETDGGGVSNC